MIKWDGEVHFTEADVVMLKKVKRLVRARNDYELCKWLIESYNDASEMAVDNYILKQKGIESGKTK